MKTPESASSDDIRFRVARLTNAVLVQQQFAPGGDAHRAAIAALLKVLVDHPGAVDELFRQQNGRMEKGGDGCGTKSV